MATTVPLATNTYDRAIGANMSLALVVSASLTSNDVMPDLAAIQRQFDTLKGLVTEWMVTDEDISMQQAIGQLLKARGKTLGTAESCTGGYIAHLITSIPGSSHYFKGSVVSYANEVKEKTLE